MGACYIDGKIKGDKTPEEVKKEFAKMQKKGIHDHGHDPYNGTWSTMSGVKVEPYKEFEWEGDAEEYVSNTAQKWGNAIAVRLKDDGAGKACWYVGGWAAE